MDLTSTSRPGLRAHDDSTRLAFPELVEKLAGITGRKLLVYIANLGDTRAVERWVNEGSKPYGDAEKRIRFTYQLVVPIADHDSREVVQSWLTGLNPELKDRTPIRLLREEDLDKVGPELLAAARAFIAGG